MASLLLGAAVAFSSSGLWVVPAAPILAIAAIWCPVWLALALAIVTLSPMRNPLLANFTAADAFLVLVALKLALTAARRPIALVHSHTWLVGFIGWAWLSVVANGVDPYPLARISLYATVSVLLALTGQDSSRTAWAIVAYTAATTVLTLPNLPQRLAGAYIGDPQQYGMLLLAALAISLLLPTRVRYLRPPLVILFVFALIATRTRGVWLAALVLGAVWLSSRYDVSRRQLVGMTVVIVAMGFVLYGPVTDRFRLNPQSAEVRQESINEGIIRGRQRPLIGVGWASFSTDPSSALQSTLPSPFNVFVTLFAYTGLVGLGLFCIWAWRLIETMLRRRAWRPLLFVLPFLVLSLSEPSLYAGSLMTILFFLFAADNPVTSRPSTALPTDSDQLRTRSGFSR
jgi:hypothetical protein